jgi:hypothetical protein
VTPSVTIRNTVYPLYNSSSLTLCPFASTIFISPSNVTAYAFKLITPYFFKSENFKSNHFSRRFRLLGETLEVPFLNEKILHLTDSVSSKLD